MTQDKKLDRKSFLTSTVAAWATLTLGGCSDDGEGGGTDDGGGATGGSATGGTATGGTATGGSAGMLTGQGGTATGGTATGGGAGMSGGSGGMMSGGSGGSGGGGGDMYVCTADTDNGMHSHPLTIPSSDVERGFQEAPYILEDGGTGHTHTLELAAYEWFYLAGGMEITAPSSMDAGHIHDVVVNCVPR